MNTQDAHGHKSLAPQDVEKTGALTKFDGDAISRRRQERDAQKSMSGSSPNLTRRTSKDERKPAAHKKKHDHVDSSLSKSALAKLQSSHSATMSRRKEEDVRKSLSSQNKTRQTSKADERNPSAHRKKGDYVDSSQSKTALAKLHSSHGDTVSKRQEKDARKSMRNENMARRTSEDSRKPAARREKGHSRQTDKDERKPAAHRKEDHSLVEDEPLASSLSNSALVESATVGSTGKERSHRRRAATMEGSEETVESEEKLQNESGEDRLTLFDLFDWNGKLPEPVRVRPKRVSTPESLPRPTQVPMHRKDEVVVHEKKKKVKHKHRRHHHHHHSHKKRSKRPRSPTTLREAKLASCVSGSSHVVPETVPLYSHQVDERRAQRDEERRSQQDEIVSKNLAHRRATNASEARGTLVVSHGELVAGKKMDLAYSHIAPASMPFDDPSLVLRQESKVGRAYKDPQRAPPAKEDESLYLNQEDETMSDHDAKQRAQQKELVPKNQARRRATDASKVRGSSAVSQDERVTQKVNSLDSHTAPATMPFDDPPLHQESKIGPAYNDRQKVPPVNEEESHLPDTMDEEQGVSPPGMMAPTQETNETQDEVYSAYVPATAEERRRRCLENAVSATNVHVVEKRRHRQTRSKCQRPLVLVTVIIAMAVGISLGIALGRKDQPTQAPVAAPTPAPTSSRFGQVASLVETLFNTTVEDPLSPQYEAIQWMAENDTVFDDDLSTVDRDRFSQRYVLALLFFATGGPSSWDDTSFFLKPGVHECEWWDTVVKDTTAFSDHIGVYKCSSDQWATNIEISQNNLTGTMPREIGSLSSLIELTFVANSIVGTLPSSLFSLPHLRSLNFWANKFNGTIPTEVGRSTSLRALALHGSSLTGTIPTEIGDSNLELIMFGGNYLTGSLPETLLHLSDLRAFEVETNALTGTLPPMLWSSWPKLELLGMSENLLSGTIPNNLDSLSLLRSISIGDNLCTGPFPSSITALTNVTTIGVSNNTLTGTLPNDWSNLSRTLLYLGVNLNRLTGSLPESLGSLAKLETLYLHQNEFSGKLPASLGNLTKLNLLVLGSNRFTGTVPTSFVQLTSLGHLLLIDTEITGDLSFLCNGTEKLLPYLRNFAADCLKEEVICPCCSTCCSLHGSCIDV